MTHFKKLSLLILSLLVSIFLVACSQLKSNSLQLLDDPVSDSRATLKYRGDQVLKETFSITYLFEPLSYTPDEAKTAFRTMANPYKNIKGVSLKEDFQDDRFVLTIEIDYSKLDFKESPVILNIDEVADDEHISYEKTLEAYKNRDFTEVEGDNT